ncbi:MAG: hypothetical protein RBR86_04925 [Pseudobdellovibrionaceae bacterium]|nr:hypothetical protein [Pseudobdellovibrionaceae bacterium]
MRPLSSSLAHVFDFDNVFYDSSKFEDYNAFCVAALADAAMSLPVLKKAGLTHEEAVLLADSGYQTYRDTFTSFCLWGGLRGIPKEDIIAPIYREYNVRIKTAFLQYYPQLVKNRTDLQQAFRLTDGHVLQGIASHSCRQNLLLPLVENMGIRQHFQEHAICGLEQSEFKLKHITPTLVERSFAALGVDPNEGTFPEDTVANLLVMKDHYPGCLTVHIHHGRPLDKKPSYVDFEFHDIPEMKRAWQADKDRGTKVIYSLPDREAPSP